MTLRPLLSAAPAALVALTALAACSPPPPPCPDTPAAPAAGARVAAEDRAVVDPTAGGRLSGVAPARPARSLLLIDYSGSMYAGYGESPPDGCPSCVATVKDGRPARNDAPYYSARPEFRALLSGWLQAADPGTVQTGTAQSGPVQTGALLFNADLYELTPSGPAPFPPGAALSLAPAADLARRLDALPDSPYRTDPHTPDRTETAAALRRAIDAITAPAGAPAGEPAGETSAPQEGILWLVTDNIVDTAGADLAVSADDAARNRAFYQLLQDDPRVQWVYAWPLHQPDTCGWMCGTSLLVYGIYVSPFERTPQSALARIGGVGPDGEPAPGGLLWNPSIRDLAATFGPDPARVQAAAGLAGVPLRLKPTDTNVLSVRFQPRSAANDALLCDQSAEYGQPVRCTATAVITNTLRHQSVDGASLSLQNGLITPLTGDRPAPWASAVCPGTASLLKWQIQGDTGTGAASGEGDAPIPLGSLPPLSSRTVELLLQLPPVQVAPVTAWDVPAIAFQSRLPLAGEMIATVSDITTRLSIPESAMSEVYGLESLPSVFQGVQGASLVTATPVQTSIRNDGQLFGLLLAGAAMGFVSAFSIIVARFQKIQYTVLVDGVVIERISMERISSRKIEINKVHRFTVRRGWNEEARIEAAEGMRVRTGVGGVTLVGKGGEERRVEVRRGWNRA